MSRDIIKQVSKRTLPFVAVAVLGGAGVATISHAEPPSNVTPEVLSVGTFKPFKVKSSRKSPIRFWARSKAPMDIVVRRHSYAPGGSTGWHTHPGPILITVTKGTLTFYERHDSECRPHVVSADPAVSKRNTYVDSGHGHIARNETGEPAEDISVITSPVGGPFRTDLPQEGSPCSDF